jgi:hypothetical protein
VGVDRHFGGCYKLARMAERIFNTLGEVKKTFFPNRTLDELEGKAPVRSVIEDVIKAQREAKEAANKKASGH